MTRISYEWYNGQRNISSEFLSGNPWLKPWGGKKGRTLCSAPLDAR